MSKFNYFFDKGKTIPELNRKTDHELRLEAINEGLQRYIAEIEQKNRELQKNLADEERRNKALQDQLIAYTAPVVTAAQSDNPLLQYTVNVSLNLFKNVYCQHFIAFFLIFYM